MSTARISPTAHYTGHVWLRNGLADPAFATREGQALHRVLRPLNVGSRLLGGPTIDGMLLARHRVIDLRLEQAIRAGRVRQVIEVAAGLSPRGWRMSRKYDDLVYVEADLPGMAAKKRALVARAAPVGRGHRVVDIDALAEDGPTSIAGIAGRLDAGAGTAIITEGLVNYFPGAVAAKMWRRFAAALGRFPHGLYLTDLSTRADAGGLPTTIFRAALGTFVRGGVYLDFDDEFAAKRELLVAGFSQVLVHHPAELASAIGEVEEAGARKVRIVEAVV